MEDSYDGRFVVWTIRTTDYSYEGLFVPFVNSSHNTNCWCQGVPPGCLINASRPKFKTIVNCICSYERLSRHACMLHRRFNCPLMRADDAFCTMLLCFRLRNLFNNKIYKLNILKSQLAEFVGNDPTNVTISIRLVVCLNGAQMSWN